MRVMLVMRVMRVMGDRIGLQPILRDSILRDSTVQPVWTVVLVLYHTDRMAPVDLAVAETG